MIRLATTTMLLLLALPSVALAHPEVDEGKRLLMDAEFEQALVVFEQAEGRDDLTRDDLVELIAARCLAYLAMDDAPSLRHELSALASLAPDHRWGREAPPELSEAFGRTLEVVSGIIEVSASATPVEGGVRVDAEVENDHAEIVSELRVFTQVAGGAWHERRPGTQAAAAGQRLSYYVEAVGPGGAVLARAGSRDEPSTSEPALASGSLVRREDDDEGGVSPWVWVGVGAGVLAVVGVILAVVLATGSEPNSTQPEMPLVIGF